MCGRSYDVCIFQWVVEQSCCDKTSRVSHIDHQQGTHLVGNLAHAGIIPLTAIGTAATDNQFRFVFESQLLHLVIVYTTSFLVEVVADRVIENTRCIDVAAM